MAILPEFETPRLALRRLTGADSPFITRLLNDPAFLANIGDRGVRNDADALRYLGMTMEGRQWTATLYSHIFAIEHNRRSMGPQPGHLPRK